MLGLSVLRRAVGGWLMSAGILCAGSAVAAAENDAQDLALRLGVERGLCLLAGEVPPELPVHLARATQCVYFVETADEQRAAAVRDAAERAGLLGTRVFVARRAGPQLLLADQIADAAVLFSPTAAARQAIGKEELLRVVRPQGKAIQLGTPSGRSDAGADKPPMPEAAEHEWTKPASLGSDDWTHPYHGPDNNPQSADKIARAPYLTHFLATPWYCPMPEVTVASGGRLFKAFGHIAFKEREWPLLGTLIALNAYNGTPLWQYKLREGFMIHRNTLIATPETVYLGDDESCKLLDAATGRVKDQITLPPAEGEDAARDRVWKWMALEQGVLYALLGPEEEPATALRGTSRNPGWPWNGLGRGYARRKYPWAHGRLLVAIDVKTKAVLWRHREEAELDGRATCMAAGRLFTYSHGAFVLCLDAKTGRPLWRTADADVLGAIGEHDPAQNPALGFSSTSYAKCSDQALYFAGPQRRAIVALAAADGRLLWQYPHGNFQLVLRDGALYALGRTAASKKFDPLTGKVLGELECYRGNCTRATGTIDSIFTRGHEHTGTQQLVVDADRSTRISLMRPACQDGVLVSNGLLYWGPWMCDCNLSLVGVIAMAPAGTNAAQPATDAERLETFAAPSADVAQFEVTPADWPTYRADNRRQSGTAVAVPQAVRKAYRVTSSPGNELTAAVAAGGLVFVGGTDGIVRAIDAATGQAKWKAHTAGEIRYPPSLWEGRIFVGSHDGWIYAYEAASGRPLWRFRAAPRERMIPVYGRLSSTWPVASGALVADGVLYAAAGISSVDGTHVYALDAADGKLRWRNSSSGNLVDGHAGAGVSVQGHLLLHNDVLYLAGGNVVSPARYDIRDGRCLNQLDGAWGKAPRGRELFLVNGEVMAFDRLLYGPKEYQPGRYFSQDFVQAQRGDVLVRGRTDQLVRIEATGDSQPAPKAVWEYRALSRIEAVAVAKNAVLATGHVASADKGAAAAAVACALDVSTGKLIWQQPLPASPSPWGLAIDRDGRVLVTLSDGSLIALAAPSVEKP